MAANVLTISPEHLKARIRLKGDMAIKLGQDLPDNFEVTFFTTSNEEFVIESDFHQFYDLNGAKVEGLLVGGKPGFTITIQYYEQENTWFIVNCNLLPGTGNTGGGTGDPVEDLEKPIVFLPLPNMTPIDYQQGRHRRGKLTANAKLANPTNMKPGNRMRIVMEQDNVGSRTMAYDGAYGFKDALPPALSLVAQTVDFLDLYMTGDRTIICELYKNYSIVRPLAYGKEFKFTMNDAYVAGETDPEDGQTVQVIRDGNRLEVNGTIGFRATRKFKMRVRGKNKATNGDIPTLRLDKGDRPAFGKALVNIEGGGYVSIENVRIAGASAISDGNGTGILINAGVDHVHIEDVHLIDNENGVRSSVTDHPTYELKNVFLEKNGWAADASKAGYSHSIYAGEAKLWRASETTFYNPVAGHNIKTRALAVELRQVYSRKSNGAREIDCCDQGIMHVYDSVFWKESNAIQNNLIGIGHECLNGLDRVQEYFFYNCYFHNDIGINREVTYLENRRRGDTNNTVAVHFIDCLFGGIANTKVNSRASLLQGPYTITITGGKLGPRVPVGSSHMRFNPALIDPNASSNPLNIPETPLEQLPPMTVLPEFPAYPDFLPIPTVPPLPDYGAGSDPLPVDRTPPQVTLEANVTSVTSNGNVLLTAIASDNVGVSKVNIYINDVLTETLTTVPYQYTESLTYAKNGQRRYKAEAVDFADNKAFSTEVKVTVEIPAPHVKPSVRFSEELQTDYDNAIVAATDDTRLAAADVIVDLFGYNQKLNIYRDGVLVIKAVYSGQMATIDDGYDVYIKPLDLTDYVVNTTADIDSGSWWYELVYDTAAPNHVITGTVGPTGSAAELVLGQDPSPDVSFMLDLKLILPRSLDGLE